jgi:acetate kinase
MRAVLASEANGDPDATLAVGVYVHRLRAGVAAMAVAMNGLDALVFTGGVGEGSPVIRDRVAQGLGFLGVAIDTHVNASAVPDQDLSAPNATIRSVVVKAREDLEIARATRAVLACLP